jgi:hypothetical protein
MSTAAIRATLIVMVIAGSASRASAQSPAAEAEARFVEAEQLEAAGQLDRACDAFAASNQLEPRAGTMIRLGQCRENQKRLVSAWSSYKDALTRVKDPNKRAIAEAKVKELEPRLSRLTVRVVAASKVVGLTITRDGVALDPAQWNAAVPVDGGTYTISAQAPGHESWTTTVDVNVEAHTAMVDVPRMIAIAASAPLPVTRAASSTGLSTRRKLAIVVAGAGVAAAGAGVVLGLSARRLSDDAFALCPDPNQPCADAAVAQDRLDRAHSRARLANISYGVAGAAMVGAVVLWLTGGHDDAERPVVSATAGAGSARVDIGWRF